MKKRRIRGERRGRAEDKEKRGKKVSGGGIERKESQ